MDLYKMANVSKNTTYKNNQEWPTLCQKLWKNYHGSKLETSFHCQKKAEDRILFFPFQLQRVVRYVLPVEVLATGIKWNQAISTLFGTDQGIKMNSEQLISSEQCTFSDTNEAWLRFLLYIIKSLRMEQSSNQGRCSLIKILKPECFYR